MMQGSTTTPARKRAKLNRSPSPWGLFFRGFIKRPVMVGAVAPSSDRTINRMLKLVNWDTTRLFVEYGPGVGTFCQTILDRLPPDALYVAIDTNPDFVAYLRRTIRDPRFSVVLGSAEDVASIIADHGHDAADYILSGLPFTTLPPGVGHRIGHATQQVLRTGGAFLVYQYSPKCRSFFAPYFPNIDHEMEWWNIPPAQLYWAWKE